MGLPLFVERVEPEEAAMNADKSAARSRSLIRRQRVARRINHHLRQEERSIRIPSGGPSVPLQPDHAPEFTDIVSPVEEAELEALRARISAGRRIQEYVRNRPAGSLLSRGDEHRTPQGSRDRRSTPPQQRADAPSGPRLLFSPSAPPMPPVPEPRDFQGSRRPVPYARQGRNRPWADYRRGSHNYRTESHSTVSRRDTDSSTAAHGSGDLPALTPNFSPAHRYTLEPWDRPRSHSPSSFAYHPSHSADGEQLASLSGVRSPSYESQNQRYLPPLRRMTRRSVAERIIAENDARRLQIRAARLDGLGDRDRSLSPEGEGTWETMLTTLTPDPQLPSAGSSFASASAATSASSNPDSQGTSLTIMSSVRNEDADTDRAAENFCVLDDSELSSAMSDTDLEDEEDMYELQDGHDRFSRSYAGVVAPRVDQAARYHGGADSDNLGSLQRIVRSLARREDIPDEWWAEAGLSRNLSP